VGERQQEFPNLLVKLEEVILILMGLLGGGEKGVRAADVTKRKRMRLKEWREHVVKSSPKRYGSDTKTAFSPVKFFQLGGILL
jgi:hypothetical protein